MCFCYNIDKKKDFEKLEQFIAISCLNSFLFCPASIYFQKLYSDLDGLTYESEAITQGKINHEAIDNKKYSSRKDVLCGTEVFSNKLQLQGNIDIFDIKSGLLTERKTKIKFLYDGYIFQLYAQYYALTEMGYNVKKLKLYSMSDNKNYPIPFPDDNPEMKKKFFELLEKIQNFDLESFEPTNIKKCQSCIYEPSCDRSLVC